MARLIAGVDEVGRGPLAGPVVAAAVILQDNDPIIGLADSKKLSATKREQLAVQIKLRSFSWALGRAEVHEIDAINILQASLLAMQRAVAALTVVPEHIQVDGNRCPAFPCSAEAIIKGDQTVACISAASIIAKVARDQEMVELAVRYPGYGLEQHKGYPTKDHLAALQQLGISAIHRLSFAPVRALINNHR